MAGVFALWEAPPLRPLQSLTLEAIVDRLATTFRGLKDWRAANQLDYALHDTLMSGVARMVFQQPSLLQFQRAMRQKRRRCNLETLFGVTEGPADTQRREILDGSEYFHSTQIPCPQWLRRTDTKGDVHYSPQVVAATVGRAGSPQGVPLDAEEGRNPEESRPQDCELKAGKRLVERLRREHPQLARMLTRDDLYAQVPCVEQLQAHRLHYVLVAKPASPPCLWERGEGAERCGKSPCGHWQPGTGAQRRPYAYRLVREMPLAFGQPVRGTWVEVWERAQPGKLRSHNSWITDLAVAAAKVSVILAMGRTRWKLEKEQVNGQTNQGYERTHHYGHGQKTRSRGFYWLNLLACVPHGILERGDRVYQRGRAQESRRELGAALRTILHVVLVERGQQLLLVYLAEEAAGP